MSDFPITREQFAAWLDAKADNEIVGQTCCSACPIAASVRELTGQRIAVNCKHWTVDRKHVAGQTPQWAQLFIDTLDFGSGLPMNTPVRTSTARRILSEVP